MNSSIVRALFILVAFCFSCVTFVAMFGTPYLRQHSKQLPLFVRLRKRSLPQSQWSKQSAISDTNCDALFGNNFDTTVLQCSDKSRDFDFKCVQNSKSESMYCESRNLILDPKSIQMSKGNEDISSVEMRAESDEFPKYGTNAILAACAPRSETAIPSQQSSFYLSHFIQHLQRHYSQQTYDEYSNAYCTDESMTYLLLTRYEYANLFHTLRDWYNVYRLLSILGLRESKDVTLVFLDGHSKGALDSAWTKAFGNVTFVKHLHSPLCMKRAVLVNPGYTMGLSVPLITKYGCEVQCGRGWHSDHLSSFGHWFAHKMGAKPQSRGKHARITLICRKDYIAHPRNPSKRVTRKFVSDQRVADVVRNSTADIDTLSAVTVLYLEDMSVESQMAVIANTDVLIGAHGAGMSHAVFLPKHASVIEIVPFGYLGRVHMRYLARLTGHSYSAVHAQSIGQYDNVEVNETELRQAVKNALLELQLKY